jgi:DNA repair exonuclease SbcCD nuclease subunit
MVRIILTSDLHLDTPDRDSPVKNRERIATFRKIVTLSKEYDILLIAGDLFDAPDQKDETIAEASRLLSTLRASGTKVLFAPGDRDTKKAGQSSKVLSLPFDKVFADSSPDHSPFFFRKDGQTIYIHGAPASSGIDLTAIEKKPDDGFHIGLFHARFDRENNETCDTVPSIRKDEIRSLKLDFYALGHSHSFRLYKYADRIIGAYPGSPEAVSDIETGDRYVLSLAIENNTLSQIKRLTINTVSLIRHTIDCSQSSREEVLQFLEVTASARNALQLTLTGTRSFPLPFQIEQSFTSRYYSLEIQDRSTVPLDLLVSELEKENSIRGSFFSMLRERLDRSAFPGDIDKEELAMILGKMTRSGITHSEEWLCALFNA